MKSFLSEEEIGFQLRYANINALHTHKKMQSTPVGKAQSEEFMNFKADVTAYTIESFTINPVGVPVVYWGEPYVISDVEDELYTLTPAKKGEKTEVALKHEFFLDTQRLLGKIVYHNYYLPN